MVRDLDGILLLHLTHFAYHLLRCLQPHEVIPASRTAAATKEERHGRLDISKHLSVGWHAGCVAQYSTNGDFEVLARDRYVTSDVHVARAVAAKKAGRGRRELFAGILHRLDPSLEQGDIDGRQIVEPATSGPLSDYPTDESCSMSDDSLRIRVPGSPSSSA